MAWPSGLGVGEAYMLAGFECRAGVSLEVREEALQAGRALRRIEGHFGDEVAWDAFGV